MWCKSLLLLRVICWGSWCKVWINVVAKKKLDDTFWCLASEQFSTYELTLQDENIYTQKSSAKSVVNVKMEIPVLVRSMKTIVLSSTSFQMDKTFWGVVRAAVGQSRLKANMVAQRDGNFGPWGWPKWPQDPSKPKEKAFLPNYRNF